MRNREWIKVLDDMLECCNDRILFLEKERERLNKEVERLKKQVKRLLVKE